MPFSNNIMFRYKSLFSGWHYYLVVYKTCSVGYILNHWYILFFPSDYYSWFYLIFKLLNKNQAGQSNLLEIHSDLPSNFPHLWSWKLGSSIAVLQVKSCQSSAVFSNFQDSRFSAIFSKFQQSSWNSVFSQNGKLPNWISQYQIFTFQEGEQWKKILTNRQYWLWFFPGKTFESLHFQTWIWWFEPSILVIEWWLACGFYTFWLEGG